MPKIKALTKSNKNDNELIDRFKTFMNGYLHMSVMDLMQDRTSSKNDSPEQTVADHFNVVTNHMLPILQSTDALDATNMEKARAHEFNEKVMGQQSAYDRNRYLCMLEDKWHQKHVVKKLYHNIMKVQKAQAEE